MGISSGVLYTMPQIRKTYNVCNEYAKKVMRSKAEEARLV